MHSAGAPIRHAITLLLAGSVASFAARARAQQPMQAGGLAPPPPMQTGGLAPPPPGSGPPPPAPVYANAAQRQLEDAEHSDSGRGLEFVYFDVGGGGQFVSLDALSSGDVVLPPGVQEKTSSFGPYFSAGAGLRLLFFTVGPRFRFGTFSDWDLWTLNLDLGWHIPLGNLEPYASLGGGFAKLASHAAGDASTGFDVRLGGGLDYYVSNVLSVGGKLDVDLLRLSQTLVFDSTRTQTTQNVSSLGLVLTAGAVAGVHF